MEMGKLLCVSGHLGGFCAVPVYGNLVQGSPWGDNPLVRLFDHQLKCESLEPESLLNSLDVKSLGRWS